MTKPSIGSQPRLAVLLLTIAGATLLAGQNSQSQGRAAGRATTIVRGREALEGEVLVKFTRPLQPAERFQLESQLETQESESLTGDVTRFRSRVFNVGTLLTYMLTRGDVEYVEPNYILRAIATPNDTGFGNLWGLLNTGQSIGSQSGVSDGDIDATDAWDVSTGSKNNVVAVIDTGIDYDHDDLKDNVWSAPSEFTVDVFGVQITCPAGSHGYNTIARSCDPRDDHGHGTHVTGTIGAKGNNDLGVAGVNWNASVMGIKFLDAGGSGSLSNAVIGIEFAIQARNVLGAAANVRVLSNSWGGGGFSQTLLDEINKANAHEMMFVAAAGNNNSNNDLVASYPASYNTPNMIVVAATDNTDQRAGFSNYGATKVHLAAPGVNVLSTTPNNTYSFYSGTSMATPHVAGAAALILSKCALDTADLKTTILNHVDLVPALTGLVATNGRLNVDKAIRSCGAPPTPPPAPPAVPPIPAGLVATSGPKKNQISLGWNDSTGATSYTVKVSGASGGPYSIETAGVTANAYTDSGLRHGRRYYYVVSAVNSAGESGNSIQATAIAK